MLELDATGPIETAGAHDLPPGKAAIDPSANQRSTAATSTHPPAGGQIESLNGLRGVSVIMVIGSHLATSVSTPPSIGAALKIFDGYLFDGALGVRIFFCISGFLITHLLLREREKTGAIS